MFFIMAGNEYYPSPRHDDVFVVATQALAEQVVTDLRERDLDYITVFTFDADVAASSGGGIRRFQMPTKSHPKIPMWDEVK